MSKKNIVFLFAFAWDIHSAMAANASRVPRFCPSHVAASSTYFVPHINDYCGDGPQDFICQSFRREVRMQGTGTLRNGNLLKYTGTISSSDGCNTAIGAAGVCLTPFFSVAADLRYHRAGDIIEIPAMRGRIISLPDGRTIVHPGFFIVEDTGGAIRGPNRFDFFTGSMPPTNASNAFGYHGDNPNLRMSAVGTCSADKEFRVIRAESSVNSSNVVYNERTGTLSPPQNSSQYLDAVSAIKNALLPASSLSTLSMTKGAYDASRGGLQ